MIQLYHGDCLKLMFDLPDNSVDMVCCDMPYGTTACKWDTVLPLDMLWYHYKRICKDNAAIVLNASQPFTTALINSNPKWFKYCWTWNKDKGFGMFLAKRQPLRTVEDICVFYAKQPTYNPQMTAAKKDRIRPLSKGNIEGVKNNITGSNNCKTAKDYDCNVRYPLNLLTYSKPVSKDIHPTQKPVELIEYLIKTYTNEGDTVLDNCVGSGTTGVACQNLNRNFIGIELDDKYYDIALDRIYNAEPKPELETA